jgi:hypothetical protein
VRRKIPALNGTELKTGNKGADADSVNRRRGGARIKGSEWAQRLTKSRSSYRRGRLKKKGPIGL